MPKHASDWNQMIIDISYAQISCCLKAHGWVHEKTVESIDFYNLETGQSTC